MSTAKNAPRRPPYKAAGAVLLVILAAVTVLIYYQFRGDFSPKTRLTMIASRAGLVMDPGSKVTYNGVEIGKVHDPQFPRCRAQVLPSVGRQRVFGHRRRQPDGRR
jgi:ABC-type transporter Mla subunit MlaD